MLPVILLVSLSLLPTSRPARGQEPLETLEQQAFRAAVDRVAPSVVRIETVGGLDSLGGIRLSAGPTTGLVVAADGYVVSSAFSFLSRPDSILVQLPDGRRKAAQLVATDHNRMLVLLKIDADEPLAVPEIVPRAEMRVGQWAIAVGRTFDGNRPNMSVGIVSALERVWGKAIQTDAAVSPNNYGGPLVDVRGRVLGVLVPLSPQAGNEIAGVEWYDSGIGFAVPACDVQRILPKLQHGEDLYPGLIGVGFPAHNVSTAEAVIAACHPNSPARDAGLQAGDRIVEIDGRRIVRASQVKEQLGRHDAGETVHVVVLRDQQRIECDLELVAKLEPYEHPLLGILPMRASGQPGQQPTGATVRYVYPNGPAARAGIAPGDLLVGLGGEPIRDADELRRRISNHQPDDEVELQIRRGGKTLTVQATLGRLPEDVPPAPLPPARPVGQREGGPPAEPGLQRPQAGSIQLKIPEFENDAWAYVPADYDPAVRYGLVVCLPPPGEFDWDALLARWKPHCDRDGLILLAPKPASPDGWQMREITLVRKLIDELNAGYTLDPTRIVVHGQRAGGRLAYLVAFAGRDLVRGVAAIDAPLTGRPPQNDPLYRLAFYAAWSKTSRDADRIEAGVAGLRGMKYPVTVGDVGKQPRGLDAGGSAELVRWIDTLDRI